MTTDAEQGTTVADEQDNVATEGLVEDSALDQAFDEDEQDTAPVKEATPAEPADDAGDGDEGEAPAEEPEKSDGDGDETPAEEKQDDEDAEPVSALEAAQAAADKKFGETVSDDEPEPKGEPEPEPEPAPKKVAPEPEAKGPLVEKFNAMLGKLKDVKILDPIDGDDKHESTFGQLAEEYPAVMQAVQVVADTMISEAVQKIGGRLEGRVAELQGQLARSELFKTLAGDKFGHPDAEQVAASPEFREWARKQSPGVQRLANSPDPADAAMVLNAYKEATGLAKKSPKSDKREREDALHRGTLRTKSAVRKTNAEPTQEDLDREFNEYDPKD